MGEMVMAINRPKRRYDGGGPDIPCNAGNVGI
jgi:hypothetical protein